ncbi:DinB family protein [Longimicrobium sp.]|uniref:DinB family protein n=1 Tax=Longimicrobium sp. TaxID=2029185 RepID=UPI002D09BAEA|nr:DinB family protein [Longimicrobium sp.]HSU16851.1 DinB family protein [Longimicrobium sp.]
MADTTAAPVVAHDALSFRELLGWTGEETARWEEWLRAQDPAVLAVSLGEGKWATVGDLVFHICVVERRYTERLYDEEPSAYEGIPRSTLDEIFAVHHATRARLERWVAAAPPEEWEKVLTFETITAGTLRSSKRKIVAHVLMHGVRHWAQISTALRQAGHPQPWMHDLIMTTAMP